MSGEWLASLKAGDEVMIPGRYTTPPKIVRVERVTPTQIVVGRNKFRRETGRQVGGDSWTFLSITEPTQEGRDRAEECDLRARIDGIAKTADTSLVTLRAMYAASKATQP